MPPGCESRVKHHPGFTPTTPRPHPAAANRAQGGVAHPAGWDSGTGRGLGVRAGLPIVLEFLPFPARLSLSSQGAYTSMVSRQLPGFLHLRSLTRLRLIPRTLTSGRGRHFRSRFGGTARLPSLSSALKAGVSWYDILSILSSPITITTWDSTLR